MKGRGGESDMREHLKVLLVYDEAQRVLPGRAAPEDFGAEYESEATIQGLLDAIRACGHQAMGAAFGEDFPQCVRQVDPDLVFNIAEGVRGPARESIAPAWLDHLGVPYTGSDGLALAVSLDKALCKTLVTPLGVRTPDFKRVAALSDVEGVEWRFPLFVKPNAEGSSMGVRYSSKVETPEELARQVQWVLQEYRQDCLVEEFAPGREFCVGLLGNDELQVLPIVEIRSRGDFYAYEDKHAHRKQLVCPADVPCRAGEQMRAIAVEVFRALRCRDLARVDFKLDDAGDPLFLEINPLPGLSSQYSIFPVQARAAGYTYEGLIGHIVELAVQRTCHPEEAETI